MGPLGIVRLFGREVWLSNQVSDGDGKVRQGDQVQVDMPLQGLPGNAYIMVGVVRYEHAVQTDWNLELKNAARIQARNMLVGGDLTRVQGHIERDSGTMGDYMRTILFGGDAYIEDSTVKGANAKAYAKGVLTVETPYQLNRF